MPIFSDDFNRANGALGGNWVAVSGVQTINSGAVTSSGTAASYNSTYTDAGRQEAETHVFWTSTNHQLTGPLVKSDGTVASGFTLTLGGTLDTPTVSIIQGVVGGSGALATYAFQSNPGPYVLLRLVYDNGHLSGYVNGVLRVEADSSLYQIAPYAGIRTRYDVSALADFRMVLGAAVELSASPAVIGNYGICTDVTLTGINTSWTSGTPGSPIFTVNHGHISAQTVHSATSATITVCPDDYLGPITITDPSTGQTTTVVATSDPGVIPPTGLNLSPTAIQYIERSAVAEPEGTIANREMSISEAGASLTLENAIGRIRLSTGDRTYVQGAEPGTNNLVDLLWQLVNGGYDPSVGPHAAPSTLPLAQLLLQLETSFAAFRTPSTITVQDVLDNLRGTGDYNHTDLYTAIQAVGTPDLQAIIDLLLEIRGSETASIAYNQLILQQLAGIGGYSLDTIKTWVEAIRGSGLPTIRDVLTKLGPGATSLEVQINALSDLIVTQTTLQGMLDILLAALNGRAGLTLADIFDLVADMPSQIDVSGLASHPVWPGVSNAVLGTEVALSNGLVVPGPMHGLLIAVTGHPPGAGHYAFGDVESWQHTGGVVFATDNGYYERAESFGLEQQILVPKTMEVAASAIIRINAGWTGTVRPWTRSA